MRDVVIVGGGIGGLALALCLGERGIPCRVFEAAPELKPLGTGISLLPHGTQVLSELGLFGELARRAVQFRESCFFNGFGQLVYRDPAPPGAPQFLIHRADLHEILLDALGDDQLVLGQVCVRVEQDAGSATAHFADGGSATGAVVVACDGIHSAVRRQLHPGEGDVVHAGITMWRGLSRHAPFLSGGSHVRVGSLRTGKLVVYPIRNLDDGTQLVNWVAEVAAHERVDADWSRPGELADFIDYYRDWHFDWLDVPKLLESAELILEYPMADRDPLDRWAHGRVALLGDAAHPMLPRGSNGAMQAVLDARTIADELAAGDDPAAALARYECRRLEPVNHVVLTNRSTPPDVLIETVHERTGDRPFAQLSDVIDEAELHALLERYKRLTGYDAETLAARAAATGGMA